MKDVGRKIGRVETNVPQSSCAFVVAFRAVVIDERPRVCVDAKRVLRAVWHPTPAAWRNVKRRSTIPNRARLALPVGDEMLEIEIGVVHRTLESGTTATDLQAG